MNQQRKQIIEKYVNRTPESFGTIEELRAYFEGITAGIDAMAELARETLKSKKYDPLYNGEDHKELSN